jgi:hypothetical protein
LADRRACPPFAEAEVQALVEVIETTAPADHGLPGHGWTLMKLRAWVGRQMNRVLSKSTFHAILRAAGLSGPFHK